MATHLEAPCVMLSSVDFILSTGIKRRMPSSKMCRRIALVRTDVSDIVFLRSVRSLITTANVVLNSPILFTLMMEAIRSSETSVYNSHTASSSRRRHSS
jgi:hypothetical protein